MDKPRQTQLVAIWLQISWENQKKCCLSHLILQQARERILKKQETFCQIGHRYHLHTRKKLFLWLPLILHSAKKLKDLFCSVWLLLVYWPVLGRCREQGRRTKPKSLSVQKMENSVLHEWGLKTFFLSQSISASTKLSDCSSDRTIIFLSAMFKIALIANKVQIKW